MPHVIIIRYCGCSSFLCSPMLVASCLDLGHRLPRRNVAGSLCLQELKFHPWKVLGGGNPTFVRPVPLEQRHVGCLPGISFIPGP